MSDAAGHHPVPPDHTDPDAPPEAGAAQPEAGAAQPAVAVPDALPAPAVAEATPAEAAATAAGTATAGASDGPPEPAGTEQAELVADPAAAGNDGPLGDHPGLAQVPAPPEASETAVALPASDAVWAWASEPVLDRVTPPAPPLPAPPAAEPPAGGDDADASAPASPPSPLGWSLPVGTFVIEGGEAEPPAPDPGDLADALVPPIATPAPDPGVLADALVPPPAPDPGVLADALVPPPAPDPGVLARGAPLPSSAPGRATTVPAPPPARPQPLRRPPSPPSLASGRAGVAVAERVRLGELSARRLDHRAIEVNPRRIGKLEPGWGAAPRILALVKLVLIVVVVSVVTATVLGIVVEIIGVAANHAISKGAGG